MTKLELGMKRRCNSCGTKFFDLNRDPIVCPKCMAVFAQPQLSVPSPRVPGWQPLPASKEMVPEVSNEERENGKAGAGAPSMPPGGVLMGRIKLQPKFIRHC